MSDPRHVSHLLTEYLDKLRNQHPSDECRVEERLYPPVRDRVEVLPRETWDPFPDELPEREEA